MICIKCQSRNIHVINSRPNKKFPSIWRRRRCSDCAFTFTTREEIALEDFITINDAPFSIPKLAISIVPFLSADEEPSESAFWIARTVGEKLIAKQRFSVSLGELKLTTKEALEHYNPSAGLQYELKHRLREVTRTQRRGRPRLKR